MTVAWVIRVADPELPSGGDRYDAAAVSRWRAGGTRVELLALPGGWPDPTPRERAALGEGLDGLGEEPVIIDGLLGGVCPEAVERSAGRRPTLLLVHLPLPVEAAGPRAAEVAELERAAVGAAHVVVTTSDWAAADVRARYPGPVPVMVAAPGVDPAPVSSPGQGRGRARQLLALGSVTPRKGLLVLIEALGALTDVPWRVVFAGPCPDADHLAALREAAEQQGIAGRVRWTGALRGADLERLWGSSDLLVHASRTETFGMVVTEAHARGIPALVVRGTGAQEALGDTGGCAVGPTATDLAEALRDWLTDSSIRHRWREQALARRATLPGWSATVEALAGAVERARREAA